MSAENIQVCAWPGAPEWLKCLARRARAVTVRGDGVPSKEGDCLFFGSLVSAALAAAGMPAAWWPCALQIQRRGVLVCQIGDAGAAGRGYWRGHLLVATGPWLVDAGIAERYVREHGLADVYIWPAPPLDGGELVVAAGEDKWVMRHPVPLPPAPWLYPEVEAQVAAEGARIADGLTGFGTLGVQPIGS